MMEYRHFTLNRWTFKNDALKALYERMSDVDKHEFDFDLWNVSYDNFSSFFYVKLMFVCTDGLASVYCDVR